METNGSRIGIVATLSQHERELSGSVATSDDTDPAPIEKVEIGGDSITWTANFAEAMKSSELAPRGSGRRMHTSTFRS
jgi:hypothetical protein